MNSVVLLRIASGLTALHAILHTIGGVFGEAAPGPMAEAWQVMKTNRFVAMGASRTYWDFYQGLNIVASISLSMEAVVLWQLATLARSSGPALRPVLWTFLIAFLLTAPVTYTYFFAAPAVFEVLIAAVLGLAIARAK